MNAKKLGIWSASMTGAIVLLSVLKNILVDVQFLSALNTIASPLLLIAALVCGYFLFKDKVSFAGNVVWAVIAIQFGLALQNLESVSYGIFVSKAEFIQILATLLYAAGCAAIVVALLDKKFLQILPAGFGALVLGAILRSINGTFAATEILLYAALVVMQRDIFPNHNYIFRIAAVVLAVLSLSTIGIMGAVCWIIFAFILVPAGKGGKFCFSFAKFTAVLCALTVILSFVAYFTGKPMGAVEYINEQISSVKEQIEHAEAEIVSLQETVAGYKEELVAQQSELVAANIAMEEANETYKEMETAYQQADANLDKICSRSYYSSWYCTIECSSLHTAVSDCLDALEGQDVVIRQCESTIGSIENSISGLNSQIESAEANITYVKENIENLKGTLASLRSRISVEWLLVLVSFVALVLGVAALGGFAYSFFAGKDAKFTLAACGALALSALLHLLTGMVRSSAWSAPTFVYLISSPHFFSIAIAVFLAVVLCKKCPKPVVFRVLTIIAAVLLGGTAVASGAIYVYVLYVITLICIALVLVPPVFTEYNSIAKHIFFTFISGGVWQLIWTYHVTKNLNKVAAVETRKPGVELALCLFLPFYYSFWLLKTGENVEAYGAEKGKQYKLDILCLVFAFLCPLVSTVLIQNKINQIVGKPE